jgi:multimeric flavodoxin WrbA
MKILGLCCSPRKQGNTETFLVEALEGAKAAGAEIELFHVAGKDLKPCQGCGACFKTGECVIKDDMHELYKKILEADGIIYASPIYFYGMTAQTKAIIDRSNGFERPNGLNPPETSLVNKVGGVIVTANSLGLVDGLKDLYFYMVTHQMIPANFVAVYPSGELKKMEKTMAAARELGQQMVLIAAQNFRYPAGIHRALGGYGTHTC